MTRIFQALWHGMLLTGEATASPRKVAMISGKAGTSVSFLSIPDYVCICMYLVLYIT